MWPSSEHEDLFLGYRRSLQEHRPIHEAPVHIVAAQEEAAGVSVLLAALLFCWDVDVMPMPQRLKARRISHGFGIAKAMP